MLIPFGILSSAGGVGEVGDYELIATEILDANSGSVVFDNLDTFSSDYKHLQIRAVVKSVANTQTVIDLGMRINGDTGSSYAYHHLQGDGSSVTSAATFNGNNRIIIGSITASGGGGTATTNQFGALVIDLLDAYSSTKNKTVRSLAASLVNTGGGRIRLVSGVRLNTAAITSLTLLGINTSLELVAGSRFSIYGIKG